MARVELHSGLFFHPFASGEYCDSRGETEKSLPDGCMRGRKPRWLQEQTVSPPKVAWQMTVQNAPMANHRIQRRFSIRKVQMAMVRVNVTVFPLACGGSIRSGCAYKARNFHQVAE